MRIELKFDSKPIIIKDNWGTEQMLHEYSRINAEHNGELAKKVWITIKTDSGWFLENNSLGDFILCYSNSRLKSGVYSFGTHYKRLGNALRTVWRILACKNAKGLTWQKLTPEEQEVSKWMYLYAKECEENRCWNYTDEKHPKRIDWAPVKKCTFDRVSHEIFVRIPKEFKEKVLK